MTGKTITLAGECKEMSDETLFVLGSGAIFFVFIVIPAALFSRRRGEDWE